MQDEKTAWGRNVWGKFGQVFPEMEKSMYRRHCKKAAEGIVQEITFVMQTMIRGGHESILNGLKKAIQDA